MSIRRADIHWCRDVDYGNLPQWLALLVGGVVAVYTVLGIRTARKSYSDDVRTREFAQARLIYANITESTLLQGGTSRKVPIGAIPGYRIIRLLDEASPLVSISPRVNNVIVTAKASQPIRVFVLQVTNNSEELISGVTVMVRAKDGTPMLEGGPEDFGIVAPRSIAARIVVTDIVDVDDRHVQVTFRDSTGLWWKREGAEPVERIDMP